LITLEVPKDKQATEKTYGFNEIKDLHDKLTLVVGKSDEEQNTIKEFENVGMFCLKSFSEFD
jgi:hypothetical protein